MLDESNAPFYKWFEDGELNASYNCLDRHLEQGNGDRVAIIFEADDGKVTQRHVPGPATSACAASPTASSRSASRRAIASSSICRCRSKAIVAMQACARIGATHSVVFGGFSAEVAAGADRRRGRGRRHHRRRADARRQGAAAEGDRRRSARAWAAATPSGASSSIGAPAATSAVAKGATCGCTSSTQAQADTCEPEWVSAEHPLFILYTSGSTGKPKGVQHSTGGYLLWAALTMKWTFDIKPSDVFWCTADIGWVTGHSYITYGPLACGATEVVFEGVPTYPHAGRFWKMIADHKVTCSIRRRPRSAR